MKIAEARAEARRLYEVEGKEIPEIAALMVRSEEGVRLLLQYGGVTLRTDPPAPVSVTEASDVVVVDFPPPLTPALLAAGAARPRTRHAARAETVRAPWQGGQVERLNPITANIVRWSRAYRARGVRLSYLAGLFNVDPDDLASAMEGRP